MTTSKSYTRFITGGRDKIKIEFSKNRGKIQSFTVQYYALIHGHWRSIMRVDTCHGYAHKHTFHIDGRQYITKLSDDKEDLNKIFTESSKFIVWNIKKIKENFLR
jgi:hypothetical protein